MLSLLQGRNESTRADPLPAIGGKRPLPQGHEEQRGCGRRGRPGARVLHTWGLARRAPSGLCQDCGTRPRPAPARQGAWKWTPAAPDRARTRTRAHAGHTTRAGPEPRHPGGSSPLDSDPGDGVREERGRHRPPRGAAGAGAALTGNAATQSPRRAALRCPRPPPERPRLRATGLAGGPADSAPRSPAPGPRSLPAPRPGHAHWPTRASEPGGAVPASQWGREREGRPHGGPGAPGFPALLDQAPVSQPRRPRRGEAALLRAC